jgi:hypothetical protein
MMTSPTGSSRSTAASRLTVLVTAMIAAVAVWAVARLIFGVDLESPGYGASMPAQAIELVWVIVVPVVVGLAGWVLLALLEKLAPARAPRIWTVVAVAVLLASLAVPLTGTGISGADRSTLALLHVAVGLVLIVGLNRRERQQPRVSTMD